jgi:hypothetical protein
MWMIRDLPIALASVGAIVGIVYAVLLICER